MATKQSKRGSKSTPSLFEMATFGERDQVVTQTILRLIPHEDELAALMADAALAVFDAWTTAKAELAEENE